MIFKKSLLSAAVFVTAIGVNLSANAATQNTADVTLSGVISAVTCDIAVNGVDGGTIVNTGMHTVDAFATPLTAVGPFVPMVVSLTNCDANSDVTAPAMGGNLYISGVTYNNAGNNIFLGNNPDTGFMILTTGGESAADSLQNDAAVPLNVSNYVDEDTLGSASYTFNVAMATTLPTPAAGLYTAPVVISYASE